MKLTKITDENRAVFRPFLFGAAAQPTPTLLQLGVADDRGRVAGVMAAETGGRYLELLSLYIIPDYRRKGYGTFLLSTFLGLADPEAYSAMSVIYSEDRAMSGFFSSMGFDLFPSSGEYSFTVGEFSRSNVCRRYIIGKDSPNVRPVSGLGTSGRQMMAAYLAKMALPLSGWYDEDWSTVLMRNGKVSSMMLSSPGTAGISLIWLYSEQPTPNEPIQHMRGLWKRIQEHYPGDNNLKIRFMAENSKMLDFTSGLLGGVRNLDWEGKLTQAIRLIQ